MKYQANSINQPIALSLAFMRTTNLQKVSMKSIKSQKATSVS